MKIIQQKIYIVQSLILSNIKTQEPLNVKQRYIKQMPSYVESNIHSKAHKKLKSEIKLKSVLSDGKGRLILIFFLYLLKWIFLILSLVYLFLGILISIDWDLYIGIFVIIFSLFGLLISYGLHKLINNVKGKEKINTIDNSFWTSLKLLMLILLYLCIGIIGVIILMIIY